MSHTDIYVGTILEQALDFARKTDSYTRLGSKPHYKSLSGGCINQVQKISFDDGACYVLKTQHQDNNDPNTFFVEQQGLNALEKIIDTNQKEFSNFIRLQVPKVYAIESQSKWMLIQYIEPAHAQNSSLYKAFGKALAVLHLVKHTTDFGFLYTLPHSNKHNIKNNDVTRKFSCMSSWNDFFVAKRLLYMTDKLNKKYGFSHEYYTKTKKAINNMHFELSSITPQPSLMHGDLWGGNHFFTKNNSVVLFDPATYYGHCEAELALTRLFGQYPQSFYRGYYEVNPPLQRWEQRVPIYNLYHLLNHWYLFGNNYEASSNKIISSFV